MNTRAKELIQRWWILLLPILGFATLAVVLAIQGCRPRPDGTPGTARRIVDCGTKAVADHGIQALPGVNRCLSGDGGISDCLLGLIDPAIGITLDVVACVARGEQRAAASAVARNPEDHVDQRRAQRGADFFAEQRIDFKDE